MFSQLRNDIRYASRILLKSPGFTCVVFFSLAIGIGANTAIFTLIHAILIKPLPYKSAEELVWLWGKWSAGNRASVSPPDFLDYRSRTKTVSHLSAFRAPMPFSMSGDSMPENVMASAVTANFMETLGVRPQLGRPFTISEEQTAHSDVVIISHRLWKEKYNGEHSVLGKTILLNGENQIIIGVMPEKFQFPESVEIWLPLTFKAEGMDVRRFHFLRPIARLKPGVSLQQAQAEFDLIASNLEKQYPDSNKTWTVEMVPLQTQMTGDIRTPLIMLMISVGVVLLIACANVGNLFLARSSTRQREISIRMSLGANRSAIVRQLLTESILLSVLSGAAGILIAMWATDVLKTFPGVQLPRLMEIQVDLPVLLFTLVLSILTAVTFGLYPALQVSRQALMESLKEGGQSAVRNWARSRFRQGLIIAEVALAVLLLVGAGLLIKSLALVLRVDPGFDSKNVLAATFLLNSPKYNEAPAREKFFRELLQELNTAPGVEGAAAISELPLTAQYNDTYFYLPGEDSKDDAAKKVAIIHQTTPSYFSVMRIPIVKGRSFSERDLDGRKTMNVIINREMAEQYFAKSDPIGRHFFLDLGEAVDCEIIGVSQNVKSIGLESGSFAQVYTPSLALFRANVVLRSLVPPENLGSVVRTTIARIDPSIAVADMYTMDQVISNSVSDRQFSTLLLASFAAIALVLAGIGIYGIMSFLVSRRTRELGVRIALGADSKKILMMVMRQGMKVVLLGLALGVVVSVGLTRLLQSMLFSISTNDPFTYLIVLAILLLISALGCVIPARRATMVDPVTALRME